MAAAAHIGMIDLYLGVTPEVYNARDPIHGNQGIWMNGIMGNCINIKVCDLASTIDIISTIGAMLKIPRETLSINLPWYVTNTTIDTPENPALFNTLFQDIRHSHAGFAKIHLR